MNTIVFHQKIQFEPSMSTQIVNKLNQNLSIQTLKNATEKYSFSLNIAECSLANYVAFPILAVPINFLADFLEKVLVALQGLYLAQINRHAHQRSSSEKHHGLMFCKSARGRGKESRGSKKPEQKLGQKIETLTN